MTSADDIDCCIRHYVQWVHGRPVTGGCSEGVDPEQQIAAMPESVRREIANALADEIDPKEVARGERR